MNCGNRPERAGSAARVLMTLCRPARTLLALATAAPFVAGLLLAPQAWLLARVVEGALIENADAASLTPRLTAIVLMVLTRAALNASGETFGARAAERLAADIRRALHASLLAMAPQQTAARSSGALSCALVDLPDRLEGFFARYVPSLALAASLPFVFAAVTLTVDPVVGALLFVTAPLIPVFMALVGWGAEAASRRHQQAFLRLSGFFADRLRGLVTLKLLGRAEAEAQLLNETSERLRAGALQTLRIAFLSSAVLEFFAALGVAGVALYVGLNYLGFLHLRASPLTLQAGLFCLLLAPEAYLPLRKFAAHYHDRAAAIATVDEISALFDGLPQMQAVAPAKRAAETCSPDTLPRSSAFDISAQLTINTLDGRPILLNAFFEATAGSRIALHGASGAGKSTLLEALAGLRPYAGQIRLGGVALDDIAESELRARVAMLSQRPHLFQATIADNIRLGRTGASDADIAAAAERAGVLRFAARLPDGLQTPIGEGGLGLSGGEAHRVALARIYLRTPGLLLLDEPTAHLDPETEAAVLDGLLDFATNRTLIVATHSQIVAERLQRSFRIEGCALIETPRRRRSASARPRASVA